MILGSDTSLYEMLSIQFESAANYIRNTAGMYFSYYRVARVVFCVDCVFK